MAAFGDDPRDRERLDWRLLQNGAVALYHRTSVLRQDAEWLRQEGYRLYELDAGDWNTAVAFYRDAKRVLGVPPQYGDNLAILIDALSELDVPADGGVALQFRRYDACARAQRPLAQTVLDLIESTSRRFLLTGRRVLGLVQSDDPRLKFERVGAVPVVWNPREWLDSARGL
jgi:RNAse (barnase) inhibitor barstar